MRGSTLFAFALTSGVAFALPGITLFKRASNPSKDVPFGLIAIRPGKNIGTRSANVHSLIPDALSATRRRGASLHSHERDSALLFLTNFSQALSN